MEVWSAGARARFGLRWLAGNGADTAFDGALDCWIVGCSMFDVSHSPKAVCALTHGTPRRYCARSMFSVARKSGVGALPVSDFIKLKQNLQKR